MKSEERLNIAVGVVETIMEDFEKSVKRTVAIFGNEQDALDKFILPQLRETLGSNIPVELGDRIAVCNAKEGTSLTTPPVEVKIGQVYTGERRNLEKLLGGQDPFSALGAIHDLIRRGEFDDIHPGDFLMIPVRMNEAHIGGLDFDAVNIQETEVVVSHVFKDRIVFQFEEVLFHSAINAKNTNDGGFAASALAEYLNQNVLTIFGKAAEHLMESNDGLKLTLPTRHEVFGEEEGEDKSVNWSTESLQLDFFKKRKNRIRTQNNETQWWWLATPSASSSANFCVVYYYGAASYISATGAGGAVSPAFCVA